ncbi:MAG: RidA family protein [Planctomycetota bacterium]|jgi:enamine deaminase RidA (YjgF/YER057c/UK114 family)
MTPEQRLAELGITLPEPPAAVAAYVPWIRTANVVMTSGQLPWREGQMAYPGKLGTDLTDEEGYQAARLCAINAVAQLKAAAGELSKVRQILRLEGYVHCGPGYRGHPQVLNGASDLFNDVFGERGRHTRLALGVNEMPLNAAVELGVWAELDP